jgi:hypothetical protein
MKSKTAIAALAAGFLLRPSGRHRRTFLPNNKNQRSSMKLLFASVAAAAITIAAPANASAILSNTITYDPTNHLVPVFQQTSVSWSLSVTAEPGFFNGLISPGSTLQINWGDGFTDSNVPPIAASTFDTTFSHVYFAEGDYNVSLSGNVATIEFHNVSCGPSCVRAVSSFDHFLLADSAIIHVGDVAPVPGPIAGAGLPGLLGLMGGGWWYRGRRKLAG